MLCVTYLDTISERPIPAFLHKDVQMRMPNQSRGGLASTLSRASSHRGLLFIVKRTIYLARGSGDVNWLTGSIPKEMFAHHRDFPVAWTRSEGANPMAHVLYIRGTKKLIC